MEQQRHTQRFFIHAGLPKTGTSYLQDILFGSREVLSEQGLELLPRRRHGHFELALKVRGLLQSFDDPATHGVLDRFADQVQRNQAPTGLLTQEALAGCTPEAVATLLEPLAGYEVHLVVTARDLGRQIPSAWQQAVKGRRTLEYAEFLDAVVARAEPARDFWRNQGLLDVLGSWSTAIPPERIHVVTCPASGASPDLLLERFAGVLGVDPTGLDTTAPTVNASLGHPQAELLRRVTVALGDRLPHSRAGYRRVARTFLSDKVLQPQRGPRALLPEQLRPWVEELTAEWTEHLATGGYDVVGDLAELAPADSSYSPELSAATETELLEAATTALAEILVVRDRELDERAEDRARIAALQQHVHELESGPGPGIAGRLARFRRRPHDG